MRIVSADDIQKALTYRALIDALAEAFRSDIVVPVRHHHTIPQDGADATLLLMPAWNQGEERFIGCKIVTVFPDNAKAQRPSVYGQYLLLSGETGEPLAMMDGRALTAWRTACASALAARYLAREDASHLVMVGAGALAPHLIRAHASVRPIKRVSTLEPHDSARAFRSASASPWPASRSISPKTWKRPVSEADIVSLRDACRRAADQGCLAEEGRASRSGRRLHAENARGRRSGGQARADLRRYPRRRCERGGRYRRAAEEENHRRKGDQGRPVRPVTRQGEGPHLGRADHAVQIGRHRDRGPGRGHAGLEDAFGLRADKQSRAR